jgi:hypothetical protein
LDLGLDLDLDSDLGFDSGLDLDLGSDLVRVLGFKCLELLEWLAIGDLVEVWEVVVGCF